MSQGIEDEKVILNVQSWLSRFVIKHNLCPFAAKPFNERRIKYVNSNTRNEKELVDLLIEEMLFLKSANIKETETSLVVVPLMFADFTDYNQFLDVVDDIIVRLDLEGVIQVASFHPDYRFADLEPDDVRNYTNRSPYPLFHLIREDSIETARSMMDTELVPDRNMDLLQDIGIEAVKNELLAARSSEAD